MAAVASYIKPSVSTGWTISSHPYTMVIEDTLLALYGPYQLCTQAMYRIKLHSLVGNCESRNVGMRNGMRNGTRNGTRKGSKMRSVPEIRCKVRHDERTCAHCEGVHCVRISVSLLHALRCLKHTYQRYTSLLHALWWSKRSHHSYGSLLHALQRRKCTL